MADDRWRSPKRPHPSHRKGTRQGRAGGRPPEVVEDSYESGTVEQAWREYLAAHPSVPRDGETWLIFRAGWRRGFGQGSLLASSTFVHTSGDRP